MRPIEKILWRDFYTGGIVNLVIAISIATIFPNWFEYEELRTIFTALIIAHWFTTKRAVDKVIDYLY